jgi:hypothetical protein
VDNSVIVTEANIKQCISLTLSMPWGSITTVWTRKVPKLEDVDFERVEE